MIFTETKLPGAFVVELEERSDDRGFFARAWCKNEFAAQGITVDWVQANQAMTQQRGTWRGFHYQAAPHREAKFIRCIAGAIYDAIIDLRPESATYKQWFGIELSAENRKALYIPQDFAHGYMALQDNSEVLYFVSEFYTSGAEQGIRYNDPAFDIRLPLDVQIISEKDKTWPDYTG